jgi:hypothetical protein
MNTIYDNYGKNFNKIKMSGFRGDQILKMIQPVPKKQDTDKEKSDARLLILKSK